MKLIIISGRAGSGKSISLHLLEDLGFYCIDNMPVALLPSLVKELSQHHSQAAISIDARNIPTDTHHFNHIMKEIKGLVQSCEILYFDADDNTLLKRFSETRRKHPLTTDVIPLHEALKIEQNLLQPLSEMADLRVDTSRLTTHQLRDLLKKRIALNPSAYLSLLFQSFGYKYGVPPDADFVFDARCLPNPYWQPELRSLTGLDSTVNSFLNVQSETQQLLKDIKLFLETWIPRFIADNRNYLTIAIGCTGGQHRSVYIAEQLSQYFAKSRAHVQVHHRELG